MQIFTQLPDYSFYSAPCVPISTPPGCTARNCDIYRDLWEGKLLEVRFLKILKYLLGGK